MANDSPFDYNSDEEPPPEHGAEKHLWRLDPAISHSDFVVEVTAPDGSVRVDTYHVHKSVLSLGPRKSEYFAHLLQGSFSEVSQGVCRISLDAIAADAFPSLLDFLYGTARLECTTETATALHFLGQYFGIRRLRWQARQFWTKDISLENVSTYYQHACLFQDERVLRRIQVDLGSEQLLELSPEADILRVMSPEFFLTVLQTADLVMTCDDLLSLHASKLVVVILENHFTDSAVVVEDMDDKVKEENAKAATLFLQLTEDAYLPEIHSGAALRLLELEKKIVQPSPDTLTSLQQRCLLSMTRAWHHMKLDDDIMARLAQVASPVFLTELLMHSLTHAKETFSLQKVKIISLNSQNSHLSTSLSAVEEEVRRLHATVQRKENSIQKWRICYERSQSRVRALDKTLQRYRSPTSESQRQGMALDIPTLGL